ncbi:glycosyltransferase family 9 protein [Flavobacterium sp.]|uniref:glycosyltransferase family 9 protein n=1 Tax=Flavobacterium sp. TaxID=239 RepID=UPI002FDAF403
MKSQERPLPQKEVLHVLVVRPNHRLGNQLLLTPLLQELEHVFPNCEITLLTRGSLSRILFSGFPNVKHFIQLPKKPFDALFLYLKTWIKLYRKPYDLVVNVDGNSSSGRIATRIVKAPVKLYGENQTDTPLPEAQLPLHLGQRPVALLRAYMERIGFKAEVRAIPHLHLPLSLSQQNQGFATLQNLVSHPSQTLVLFTYATGRKLLPKSWWQELYAEIKAAFPHYSILELLPNEKVSQLDFCCPTYYSDSVHEIAALLQHTQLFVGTDSGIMHLASASGVPTLGLFSVSSTAKYAPYGKNQKGINILTTTPVEIVGEMQQVLVHSKCKKMEQLG